MPHPLPTAVDENELAAWIAWASLSPVMPADRWLVLEHFGTLGRAWTADAWALQRAGLSPRVAAAVIERRPSITPEAIRQRVARDGVKTCTILDAAYPPLLKHIHDPPLVLFYRGTLPAAPPAVAIVGTRRASDYGLQVAWELAEQLAAAGVTVVSGLAYGVDGAAHRATLEAGGCTVAVLGGGVNDATVYPAAHRELAGRIALAGGAVVSEYPPATPPLPLHFPQRNRLIAGMTLGTVVVEAPLQSGALVTARLAAEENREVFAVPGRITDENAAGVNHLIANGAALIACAADLLAALNLPLAPPPPARGEAGAAGAIPRLLDELAHPKTLEELRRAMNLPASVVASQLTLLEVRGLARRLPSGKFHRTNGSQQTRLT